MRRPYTTQQATAITETFLRTIAELERAVEHVDDLPRVIARLANAGRADAIRQKLQEIPLERLHEKNGGVRVALLRDAGYATVADVSDISEKQLRKIRGVGQKTAAAIRDAVERLKNEEILPALPLELALSEQNAAASAIVRAAAAYETAREPLKEARSLLQRYRKRLTDNVRTVEKLQGIFAWTFAGAQTQQDAAAALDELDSFAEQGFLQAAQELAARLKEAQEQTVGEAWSFCRREPERIAAVIERCAIGVRASVGGR